MEKNHNTIDLYALLEHEGGKLIYEGAEGCVVQSADGETLMSDILDGEQLCRVLALLDTSEMTQIVVKSRDALEKVSAAYGFRGFNPCSQWSYWGQKPEIDPACDIRPLEPCHAKLAAQHYKLFPNTEPYITERIEAGRLWGLFEEGKLAGFIGTHSEGSMGMLEVFPEYRRKGYGMILENFLIAWHLERGWTPFGHVVDGNEASIRLQQKAGMERGDLPAIWVF